MAGLIREKSIQEVRDKARIEDVVGQYVTLKRAGTGSLKGLCPFHDEKTPSFNVNTSRNFWHCFGCGEGGDVISFVMKLDALSFAEAVERLAEKYGVALEREEGGGREERQRGPARGKLIEAHKVAAEFYAEQLAGPDAVVARQFLAERSFDRDAAEHFGVGYAPRDGDALFKHLRGRGFSTEEVVTAGLVAQGRSAYDRFRGRLLWPIRDPAGDVIGFGARRLFDDDRIEAKYLNTPESPIYKKSHVLYGIDLARKEMGRTGRAVIVEGYTDVMACHLAGVTTAVATCGTAFGDDHAKVLRRFMADHGEFHGEVVFTFDGDAAGQAAALKAFQGDQNFVSQTYVAVEPSGMDPCDLRMEKGDDAVRELIEGRQPLYRFVLGNVLSKYDLDRADGRVDALREAARLVSSIRDRSKVDAFARELAGMVGVDVDAARAEVQRAGRRATVPVRGDRGRRVEGQRTDGTHSEPVEARPRLPDPRDPRFAIERETLKLVLQHPMAVGRTTAEVSPDDFTHPAYRAVWELVAAAGGPPAAAGDSTWAARVRDAAGTPALAGLVSALIVEPLPTSKEPGPGYVLQHVVRLLELTTLRRIDDVKSRLQRSSSAEDPDGYRALFADLAALEQHRRILRDRLTSSA